VSAQDERLLGIFREEAGERLERLVETLLALDAGTPPADATDVIFREIHSLKGGAGLVGLEELRAIAHAAEELLGDARARGEQIGAEPARALLAAADVMRAIVASGTTDEAERTLAQLQALTPAGNGASEPAAVAAPSARASGLGPSIRVAAAKLDRVLDTVGDVVLHQRRIEHLLDPSAAEMLDQGDVLLDELQDAAIELRALPLSAITGGLPRHARELAQAEGKDVELHLSGVETQLDRAILDGLSDTLVHLMRNAVAHGIEQPEARRAAGKPERGRIELRAEQRGDRVAVEIADDGRGVAPELLREAENDGSLLELLARPGFSTAPDVSGVAGRGVGLDAVTTHVAALGGSIELQSVPGRGTTITLLLPLTLAVLHVLLIERLGLPLGLPVASVDEVVAVEQTTSLAGRASIALRDVSIPLGDLAAALGSGGELAPCPPALIVRHGERTAALACDRLLGEEHVTVKSLGPILGRRPGYLGGALLGDGRVALIVDPAYVVARAAFEPTASTSAPSEPEHVSSVLVVDDQFTVRELQRSILEAAGYRVLTAVDGADALRQLTSNGGVDLVVTDLEMPELDGLELLRRMRQEPALATLPVVVVTSRSSEEDRRRGLEAGADAYVTKARFDQRALLDTVERLVGR
jgi:two-component system chemotaxis sensor kinase CheA